MTMEFRDNEAIYLQIANFARENILLGKWAEEEKILSVRELASEMQVNPNTVVRTYELLEQQEIIYTKRGLGFFVREGAAKKVRKLKRDNFMEYNLPELFRNMFLLDVDPAEIIKRYEIFRNKSQYPNT